MITKLRSLVDSVRRKIGWWLLGKNALRLRFVKELEKDGVLRWTGYRISVMHIWDEAAK
jgi:hypothetical protein